MAPKTIADWYHLKDGRRSFKPDPLQDKSAVFCNQDVQESVQAAVEQAFATSETVKLLLWGDWGVGKTHTLRHLQYWLEQNREHFPARTVFAQVGDVAKSSRFGIVHKDLLDGVGVEAVIAWVHRFIQSGKSLAQALEGIGIPVPIAQAFTKFLVAQPGQPTPEIVVTSWNYLRGESVGRAGTALGLQDQISDSKDFYAVLAALGYLCREVNQEQLIFLVDEAARLEAVSQALEVERHWINVNVLIFDQANRYFGFVYTVSGQNQDSIPAALFERQIENRLLNRRIQLFPLQPDSVREFVANLRDAFVDKGMVESDPEILSTPGFEWGVYPFTRDAFDRFVDYFQRTQDNSKPRDISGKLDEACFRALKLGSRLVTEQALDQVGL